MTLSGTEVRMGMTATANLNQVNTVGSVTIGTPVEAVRYTDAPSVAYSLRMDIADGESLTLNTTTGAVTTLANPYVPAMRVDGDLTNGTDSLDVPDLIVGSELFGRLAYNRDGYDLAWNGDIWIIESVTDGILWTSTADVASPDLVPIGEWHASISPDAWKPIAPATGTPIVTASALGASAYRISGATWDQTDFEGQPLPTSMTKLHSMLFKSLSTSSGYFFVQDEFADMRLIVKTGSSNLISDIAGQLQWASTPITFTAVGNVSLTIDIHAGE